MNQFKLSLLSVAILFCYGSFGAESAVLNVIKDITKDTVKEQVTKKVGEELSVKDEKNIEPNYYISYGLANKSNDAITVVSGYDVIYDKALYHRLSFLKNMEDYVIGVGVNYDTESSDISSIIGQFGGKNWYVIVESAKLSGKIMATSTKTVFKKFDKNKYLDIKFLKFKGKDNKEEGKPTGMGVQYLTFERPSVFKKDKVVYIDPKSKLTFIGFVFELDSVKSDMLSGKKRKSHDWYFYNTSAFGLGQLKVSDETVLYTGVRAKPTDDTYTGIGINGEYELGYVYSFSGSSYTGALKIGYGAQLENPLFSVGMSEDSEGGSDRTPTETVINHGFQITLAASF